MLPEAVEKVEMYGLKEEGEKLREEEEEKLRDEEGEKAREEEEEEGQGIDCASQ